jgi:hypothetical protein
VKKPVADPKSWRVPFGKDWVTSKLQELENLVQTGGWVEAEIGEMRVSIPTGCRVGAAAALTLHLGPSETSRF